MTSVKCFVICCLIVVSLARNDQDVKKIFIRLAIECSNEMKITGEDLQILQKYAIPNSKNSKCFLACIFKKINWIDDKGMFDESNAIKLAETQHSDDKTKVDNAKKLYAICRYVNDKPVSDGENGCERSNMLAKCLTENSPKFGFST